MNLNRIPVLGSKLRLITRGIALECPPPTQVNAVDVKRLQALQKSYQEPDGKPVWMKGNPIHAYWYYFSIISMFTLPAYLSYQVLSA